MPELRRRWSSAGKEEMKYDYTNSQIIALINEHIHNERDRQILVRRLCDGVTFEHLAAEFDLSIQRTKTIVYKAQEKLFRHLK